MKYIIYFFPLYYIYLHKKRIQQFYILYNIILLHTHDNICDNNFCRRFFEIIRNFIPEKKNNINL